MISLQIYFDNRLTTLRAIFCIFFEFIESKATLQFLHLCFGKHSNFLYNGEIPQSLARDFLIIVWTSYLTILRGDYATNNLNNAVSANWVSTGHLRNYLLVSQIISAFWIHIESYNLSQINLSLIYSNTSAHGEWLEIFSEGITLYFGILEVEIH